MPTVFGITKTDFHFIEKLCALLHKWIWVNRTSQFQGIEYTSIQI